MQKVLRNFYDWPISKKLSTIVLLTSTLLIGFMAVVVSVEKYISYRSRLVNGSAVLAEVIGANVTAALIYGDSATAKEMLSALKAEKEVLAAALFTSDRVMFASYRSAEYFGEDLPQRLEESTLQQSKKGPTLFSGYFDVTKEIDLEGKAIGMMVLRVNLSHLHRQIGLFLLVITSASLFLLTFGLIICSRLNKTITDPVTKLAVTMQDVTETQNYTVRVEKKQMDEIGILIDGFNSMLSQIQRRDMELEKHRYRLEDLIDKRTEELREANVQLREEIKERQEVQTRLAHAEKMEAIGTLAGGVAHDLNNILSGIVSYPDLILLDLQPDSKLRVPIETIRASGKKAAAIVQDLLSLARRGVKVEGQVELQQQVIEYLQSPEHLELLKDYPDVKVDFEPSKEKFFLKGSPIHLNKTIMNLVSNGIEAMAEGGRLGIELRYVELDTQPADFKSWRKGTYIRLTITDTGIGIPQEYIKRIFEPFYSRKVMGKSGTGLGMAVVWGSVEDHNGYITVASKVGEGTTFQLFFPTDERDVSIQLEPEAVMEIYQGEGQTILVVDDSEDQRQIASDILKRLGYDVYSVDCGEAAVRFVQKRDIDLVVLDMLMTPGIDGLETYKLILDHRPEQLAVIASGYSQSSRIDEARELGVSEYVLKPYSVKRIGEAVHRTFYDKN